MVSNLSQRLCLMGLFHHRLAVKYMSSQIPRDVVLDFALKKDSLNVSASSQITIDTDAECDEAGEAKITELNIPLVYDTLTFDMENLDKAFDTVIQGILVVLLETQNMLAVAALRAMIAQSVGSLMCS